jgi:hypothetical protein
MLVGLRRLRKGDTLFDLGKFFWRQVGGAHFALTDRSYVLKGSGLGLLSNRRGVPRSGQPHRSPIFRPLTSFFCHRCLSA